VQTAQLGADVSVELMAGVAGIVLGVLALIGAATDMHLLPAALIVFGGAMLLAGFSATSISTVSGIEAAPDGMIAVSPSWRQRAACRCWPGFRRSCSAFWPSC